MKNRFGRIVLLLTFALLVSSSAMIAYAETEGSTEGSTVENESALSSDTTLSSLKIAQAELSPEFSPNQRTYTATVPYEVERVALTAKTNDPTATKVIRGTSDLKVGENIVTVTVTAEDGSVRQYRIALIRQPMSETTPAEGDENQSTASTDENETPTQEQETSSEEVVTEGSLEETELQEETEEETPSETTEDFVEKETTDGMTVVEPTEGSWDLDEFLMDPIFMICLLGGILVVSALVIIMAIVVLRQKRRGDEDEDDDDEDGESDNDEDADRDDDDEMLVEETVIVTVPEKKEQPVAAPVIKTETVVSEDDLDDDFEMLLEDDDDFDFLDF